MVKTDVVDDVSELITEVVSTVEVGYRVDVVGRIVVQLRVVTVRCISDRDDEIEVEDDTDTVVVDICSSS